MPDDADELLGPYERWAYGPGAPYTFGPDAAASRYVSAVAALPPGADLAFAHMPTLWQPMLGGAGQGVFCPVVLDMAKHGERGRIGLHAITVAASVLARRLTTDAAKDAGPGRPDLRVNAPVPEASINVGFAPDVMAARSKPGPSGTPAKAILAVIDDGIPFAHRNFRDRSGRSRIEFCWLQGARAAADPARHSVLFGQEYTAADIDALVDELGADEDALYLRASAGQDTYPRPTIGRFATHGAHVLDAAAGHARASPPRGMRPAGPDGDLDALRIIAVQLPAPATVETTAFGKDALILSAFHYIFERADRIARTDGGDGPRLPLIINFSYGFSGGPHNGGDRLERAIRALIRKRVAMGAPTHLVMPAGNDFLSGLYGTITAAGLEGETRGNGQAFTIPWRIQPSDRTCNYLEIWLPDGARPDGIAISIFDPAGRPLHEQRLTAAVSPLIHEDIKGRAGQRESTIGQFSIERYPTGETASLWRFVIALAPSEPEDLAMPAAPAGLWTVRLENIQEVLRHGRISCRIQRDVNPFGYARGARQSYFDDPHDQAFEPSGRRSLGDNPERAFVRRFGTLNGLATHDAVTVVAGHVTSSLVPAEYSSAGLASAPLAGAGSVHYAAPSESGTGVSGVIAAGTRSGAVFRLSGTSTSAPQIARAIAVAYLFGEPPEGLGGAIGKPGEPLGLPLDAELARIRLGKGCLLPQRSEAADRA